MPLDHLKVHPAKKTTQPTDPPPFTAGPQVTSAVMIGDSLASAKPKREKPTRPPQDLIKHRCGCFRGVKDIENTNCPACAAANRARKAEARRNKMLIDHVSKKPDEWRYPPGTEVTGLKWDGTQWSGVLQVPGCQPIGHSASGVKTLLNQFRDLYLAMIKEEKPAA